MERFKRLSLVASSLMLVLALVTVLGTKEVRAVVASMVQVVNTSANPVPTLATEPLNSIEIGGDCNFSGTGCFIALYAVPAGKTLVMESVSVGCILNAGNPIYKELLYDPGSFTTYLPLSPSVPVGSSEETYTTLNLKNYFAGGANVYFEAFTNSNQGNSGNCHANVSGYLR